MPEYITETKFNEFMVEETRHHAQDESEMTRLGRVQNGVLESIEKIHTTLYGNGSPGMDEKIRIILEYVEQQKKISANKSNEYRKYLFWGVTFLASNLAGVIVGKIIH